MRVTIVVDDARDGFRLDRFLSSRISRLSRTRVQAIVRSGQVARGGEVLLRVATRVYAGEQLVLTRPAPEEPPAVMDYGVLHRDAGLLVLDKPAGLPVHPSARYHRHTLTHLLRTRLGPEHGWELAHRLDRETSGVLLLGRSRGTASALKRAFRERAVEKRYWALVHGRVERARVVEMSLGPAMDSRVRIKMGPRPESRGGLPARTELEPLAYGLFRGEPITLLAVTPRTGRQHQIRAHLAALGHGVVGDKLYGLDERRFLEVVEDGRPVALLEEELGLGRHALHARSIELAHPLSGARVRFEAPWPAELAALCPAPST
ncbi:MAG: RluA family pseudouridine synthase [Myxococcales bacterium]|nr:RluA family pseudouridine synthase [Myxococcales bacterium]MCB9750428.1 RluA family pseudouridine synthase [Myxococcales bacterium]